MTVPVDRDQLRALAVLRYWFGELEVLAVLERVGSGEGNPPRRTGEQLALATDDQQPHVDPPSRLAVRPSRRDAQRP
jgi:hypothetical protein